VDDSKKERMTQAVDNAKKERTIRVVDDSNKERTLESLQSSDTVPEEPKLGSTIQEQRKVLLEQQRQKRVEREKQMGLHKNVSSETPLKPAISRGLNSKRNGAPKHVRFSDDKKVLFGLPFHVVNMYYTQVGQVAKKIKLDEETLVSSQEITMARSASPIHIRPSMLNLDDLPEELIPVHQEKIKQQVCNSNRHI